MSPTTNTSANPDATVTPPVDAAPAAPDTNAAASSEVRAAAATPEKVVAPPESADDVLRFLDEKKASLEAEAAFSPEEAAKLAAAESLRFLVDLLRSQFKDRTARTQTERGKVKTILKKLNVDDKEALRAFLNIQEEMQGQAVEAAVTISALLDSLFPSETKMKKLEDMTEVELGEAYLANISRMDSLNASINASLQNGEDPLSDAVLSRFTSSRKALEREWQIVDQFKKKGWTVPAIAATRATDAAPASAGAEAKAAPPAEAASTAHAEAGPAPVPAATEAPPSVRESWNAASRARREEALKRIEDNRAAPEGLDEQQTALWNEMPTMAASQLMDQVVDLEKRVQGQEQRGRKALLSGNKRAAEARRNSYQTLLERAKFLLEKKGVDIEEEKAFKTAEGLQDIDTKRGDIALRLSKIKSQLEDPTLAYKADALREEQTRLKKQLDGLDRAERGFSEGAIHAEPAAEAAPAVGAIEIPGSAATAETPPEESPSASWEISQAAAEAAPPAETAVPESGQPAEAGWLATAWRRTKEVAPLVGMFFMIKKAREQRLAQEKAEAEAKAAAEAAPAPVAEVAAAGSELSLEETLKQRQEYVRNVLPDAFAVQGQVESVKVSLKNSKVLDAVKRLSGLPGPEVKKFFEQSSWDLALKVSADVTERTGRDFLAELGLGTDYQIADALTPVTFNEQGQAVMDVVKINENGLYQTGKLTLDDEQMEKYLSVLSQLPLTPEAKARIDLVTKTVVPSLEAQARQSSDPAEAKRLEQTIGLLRKEVTLYGETHAADLFRETRKAEAAMQQPGVEEAPGGKSTEIFVEAAKPPLAPLRSAGLGEEQTVSLKGSEAEAWSAGGPVEQGVSGTEETPGAVPAEAEAKLPLTPEKRAEAMKWLLDNYVVSAEERTENEAKALAEIEKTSLKDLREQLSAPDTQEELAFIKRVRELKPDEYLGFLKEMVPHADIPDDATAAELQPLIDSAKRRASSVERTMERAKERIVELTKAEVDWFMKGLKIFAEDRETEFAAGLPKASGKEMAEVRSMIKKMRELETAPPDQVVEMTEAFFETEFPEETTADMLKPHLDALAKKRLAMERILASESEEKPTEVFVKADERPAPPTRPTALGEEQTAPLQSSEADAWSAAGPDLTVGEPVTERTVDTVQAGEEAKIEDLPESAVEYLPPNSVRKPSQARADKLLADYQRQSDDDLQVTQQNLVRLVSQTEAQWKDAAEADRKKIERLLANQRWQLKQVGVMLLARLNAAQTEDAPTEEVPRQGSAG